MSLQSKINWVLTGALLKGLRGSLKKRVEGDALPFLQYPPVKNTSIFNRIDFIIAACAGKKVLHAGFTDYPFTRERIADKSLLHLQLKKKCLAVLGIDNDEASIAEYKLLTGEEDCVKVDITAAYPETVLEFKPDIILLGEILEHLQNPYRATELLYTSFDAGTKILVTVPNYQALDNISAALHRAESIHPHHYWHFSPYTLLRLFPSEKFTLEELHFGMYYQQGKKINSVLKKNPFCGDCIIAVFSIYKIQKR